MNAKVLAAALAASFASTFAISAPPAEGDGRERTGTASAAHRTVLEVRGDRFFMNGRPTYEGRSFGGRSIEGLLFNSRMVQGTFDDENPRTRPLWAYPDTGRWDPERNTDEFVAAMPAWREHGLLAFTLDLQGGSPIPSTPFPYDLYLNSAYSPEGRLKPAYVARLRKIVDQADALGMAVVLGLSYFGVDHRFIESPAAFLHLTDEVVDHLAAHDDRNVVIEVANERTEVSTRSGRVPVVEAIRRMRARAKGAWKGGWKLLLTTSHGGGGGLPPEDVLREVDVVLLHGNDQSPQAHVRMIERTRELLAKVRGDARALPIVFNEAGPWWDYEHIETWMDALRECARRGVSWGHFDQGEGKLDGERRSGSVYLSGYQTPPVNWGISTPAKRRFFETLREITGGR